MDSDTAMATTLARTANANLPTTRPFGNHGNPYRVSMQNQLLHPRDGGRLQAFVSLPPARFHSHPHKPYNPAPVCTNGSLNSMPWDRDAKGLRSTKKTSTRLASGDHRAKRFWMASLTSPLRSRHKRIENRC